MLQCAWEAVELIVVLVLAWEGLVAYMWDDSLVVVVVGVLDDSLAQASVGVDELLVETPVGVWLPPHYQSYMILHLALLIPYVSAVQAALAPSGQALASTAYIPVLRLPTRRLMGVVV